MARPRKSRKIGVLPEYRCFAPEDVRSPLSVIITLDEYEAIRLIDYAGCNQEEAAEQMEISRTTVTAIYESARKKIAECIIGGKTLFIASDASCISDNAQFVNQRVNDGIGLANENLKTKGGNIMRIAVTFEDGKVYQHFGHSKFFKIYDVEDKKIIESQLVDTNGSGHGALAKILKEANVDALICGGIGGGAQMALADANIELYAGVDGDCDDVMEKFLAGTLEYGKEANCNHHGDSHSCGSHEKSEHKCSHAHGEGHGGGHHGKGEHKCSHAHGEGNKCGHKK